MNQSMQEAPASVIPNYESRVKLPAPHRIARVVSIPWLSRGIVLAFVLGAMVAGPAAWFAAHQQASPFQMLRPIGDYTSSVLDSRTGIVYHVSAGTIYKVTANGNVRVNRIGD